MALTNDERAWIEGHFTKVNDKLTEVLVDIAMLKVKAGVWGVLGGVSVVLTAIGFELLRGN